MRPIEKVDWNKLAIRWEIDPLILLVLDSSQYISYWKSNPDQRIGQVLINLDLIPDTLIAWNDEEYDILNDQGLEHREFLYWKSNYDSYENPLKEPRFKLIKDLDTDHLYAIINFAEKRMIPKPQVILDEIEYRKQKV